MSVAGISSTSLTQLVNPQALATARRYYGSQLEQSLNSGDLAGAQQAYNSLATFGPNNSGPFSNPTTAADFAALGQALQSSASTGGDLTAARQAFAQLQHDIQLNQHFGHPQNQAPGGAVFPEIILNLNGGVAAPITANATNSALTPIASTAAGGATSAAAGATATPAASALPEIVLNLGNGNAGPELIFNLNNGGNTASELTLNFLNTASGPELILGLGNNNQGQTTTPGINLLA